MYLKSFHRQKIKFCCRWLNRLSARPGLFSIIKAIRETKFGKILLSSAAGHFRPFSSLAEAASIISKIDGGGFIARSYQDLHLRLSEKARPSDYVALFYIQQISSEIHNIFDLGGSVGNLCYCYEKYINFPANMKWTVFDLPETLRYGAEISAERHNKFLNFSGEFSKAEGACLFIACGSLHYFEEPLFSMIAKLQKKPRYVLINRTPLVDCQSFATVQEGSSSLVACILHNRSSMIRGFENIGYEVVDAWSVPERTLIIPAYPDKSPHNYSGMFLKLNNI
jgi:putative methyltransferase (TIGR04325 family)